MEFFVYGTRLWNAIGDVCKSTQGHRPKQSRWFTLYADSQEKIIVVGSWEPKKTVAEAHISPASDSSPAVESGSFHGSDQPVTLAALAVRRFLACCPGIVRVSLSTEKTSVVFECGRMHAKFDLVETWASPLGEAPVGFLNASARHAVDGCRLVGALKSVEFAQFENPLRPHLSGVVLEIGAHGGVRAKATDGHRMALMSLMDSPDEPLMAKGFISSRDVHGLLRMSLGAAAVQIAVNGATWTFRIEPDMIRTDIFKRPNSLYFRCEVSESKTGYDKAIPVGEYKTRLVDRLEMLYILRSLLAPLRHFENPTVRLSVIDGVLSIGASRGSVNVIVSMECPGDPIRWETALNGRYLKEGLEAMVEARVTLEMRERMSVIVIRENPDFIFACMPIVTSDCPESLEPSVQDGNLA